jgi:hypothetical protein
MAAKAHSFSNSIALRVGQIRCEDDLPVEVNHTPFAIQDEKPHLPDKGDAAFLSTRNTG